MLKALAAVSLLLAGTSASAQELVVAAASDLQSVLPAVAERFEKGAGHKVKLTFGSSGNFSTQIQNGAPFDLFFSADLDYPKSLERSGFAEPGTLYAYGTGKIVLWTRKDSGIDIRQGLAVLTDARVQKIAIANPEHAPYGRAALAALQGAKLYDKVRDKLVLGENIAQAAQFAESRNAEVGILALSTTLVPALKDIGWSATIPEAFYPPITQGVVVLRASRNKELARQFLIFLQEPGIKRVMQNFGFSAPRAADERQ
jgi:molybdate transport system substrate-binding protein